MKIAEKIIAEELIFLDCALTGKPFREALKTWENGNIKDPLDFITGDDPQYYLSDGGYSRIYIHCPDDTDPECITLRLDSVSTDRVKHAWKQCKELISDIEKTVMVALKLELQK